MARWIISFDATLDTEVDANTFEEAAELAGSIADQFESDVSLPDGAVAFAVGTIWQYHEVLN